MFCLMLFLLWDPICLFLRSKYGINFQSHSLAHCIKVASTVEQVDSQSNCLIKQLQILLQSNSRCNEYVINGFTYDEITGLIREIYAIINSTVIIYLYCCCIILFIMLLL